MTPLGGALLSGGCPSGKTTPCLSSMPFGLFLPRPQLEDARGPFPLPSPPHPTLLVGF